MYSNKILSETRRFSREIGKLKKFALPVTHVYNPLEYAWKPYKAYIEKYADTKKRVVFLGMNPGPWGMAQSGVPFGEISFVRDWLGINEKVGKPENEHSKRKIEGFACKKSEVSGKRLWGLFKKRFNTPQGFFKEHIVLNYCPLVFMDKNGRNITPDKLKSDEKEKLILLCDAHLKKIISILETEWIIGVGNFTAKRTEIIFKTGEIKTGKILHPSPASPAANINWGSTAERQLKKLKVWK